MVRSTVLAQHGVLREKLRQLLAVATGALRRDAAGGDLRQLVGELTDRFRAHLAFEERWLAPLLAEVDAWGPDRVRLLLEEHERQRAELATLRQGIESGWDDEHLAVVVRSLVTDLLLDMEEEEQGCLNAELLRDDVVSVDQATD